MVSVGFEHKVCPRELQERVAHAGGFNLFGWPMFRVVWGYSRLAILGGELNEFDERGTFIRRSVGYRMEHPPGYKWERWHIEKWMPAEFYGSPEHWAEINREFVDGKEYSILGPYPSQGDYELSTTIEDADENFLPLSTRAAEAIVEAVEWSRRRRPVERKQAIERREEKKAKSWDAYCDEILSEDEPAFGGAPAVSVSVGVHLINKGKPAFPGLAAAARRAAAGMAAPERKSILVSV